MPQDHLGSVPCDPCGSSAQRAANPLLFAFFCPYCVLSGLFAVGTSGALALPPLLGMPVEQWLAPMVVLGPIVAWISWGWWARQARSEPRSGCSQPDGSPDEEQGKRRTAPAKRALG